MKVFAQILLLIALGAIAAVHAFLWLMWGRLDPCDAAVQRGVAYSEGEMNAGAKLLFDSIVDLDAWADRLRREHGTIECYRAALVGPNEEFMASLPYENLRKDLALVQRITDWFGGSGFGSADPPPETAPLPGLNRNHIDRNELHEGIPLIRPDPSPYKVRPDDNGLLEKTPRTSGGVPDLIQDIPDVRPRTKPKPPSKLSLAEIGALLDKREAKVQKAAPEAPKRTSIQEERTRASIQQAIASQVERCWSPPAGASYANTLIIKIQMHLRPDGSLLREPEIMDKTRMVQDSFFEAAAEAAVRAIQKCAPFDLPKEDYDVWAFVELNFDPSKML